MARTPRKDPRIAHRAKNRRSSAPPKERAARELREDEHLFLGEWLSVLKRKQVEAAEAAEVTKAYVNNLINPPKGVPKEPSVIVMLRISRFLKVTVNDLYKRPPVQNVTESFRGYSPEARAALMQVSGLSS